MTKIRLGKEGEVRIADSRAALSTASCTYVEEVTFTNESAIDMKYVINMQSPYAVVEGNTELTGSIEKPFEDVTLANWVGVQASGSMVQPTEKYLGVFPQGFASGNDALIFENVKFTSWNVEFTHDDFVVETADFTALKAEWTTCDRI